MVVVDEMRCVGCARCLPFCPEEAIKVYGQAEIDGSKCNECFLCMENCPNDALFEEGDQQAEKTYISSGP